VRQARRWISALGAIVLASCSSPPTEEEVFQAWLAADSRRAAAFTRFEASLEREGVLGVVPSRQLWFVDRLQPRCVTAPYVAPPEEAWTNIAPALRIIRDHVEPAIGAVRVVSGYREEAFNACLHAATRSAHRGYHALDLVPEDRRVTRAQLIAALCPIYARDGRRTHLGLGIYAGVRFHIDAHGYRGWGNDYHATTFPCGQG